MINYLPISLPEMYKNLNTYKWQIIFLSPSLKYTRIWTPINDKLSSYLPPLNIHAIHHCVNKALHFIHNYFLFFILILLFWFFCHHKGLFLLKRTRNKQPKSSYLNNFDLYWVMSSNSHLCKSQLKSPSLNTFPDPMSPRHLLLLLPLSFPSVIQTLEACRGLAKKSTLDPR